MTTQVDEAKMRVVLAERRWTACKWMRDKGVARIDDVPHHHAIRDAAGEWAREAHRLTEVLKCAT